MKNILLNTSLLIIVLIFGAGCADKLDIQPEDNITPSQVTEADINALANGMYASFRNSLGARIYEFELLGNNFVNSNLFSDATPFLLNDLDPTMTENWWSEIYSSIYTANTVLEAAQNIGSEAAQQEGTARYCRALAYYYLVTRFGGVPLLPENQFDIVLRSSEEETWQFILNDLNAAVNLVNNYSDPYYVSQEAVNALLARVYLSRGNNSEAANLAESLIANSNFQLENDFTSIFDNNISSELIFGYSNVDDVVAWYLNFNPNDHPISGGQRYIPNDDVWNNLFVGNDNRKERSIRLFNNQRMVNKFSDNRTIPVIISRISEIYLISAEAQGFPAGLARLNELRNTRGLDNVNPSSQEEFINEVLDERRREFFAEGFYWYDLVRTGKATERISSITNDNQLKLPIPQIEVDLAGLQQNPGY